MTAYYNEFDKGAAAWLRELIKENLIAPGVVDERSIADVTPGDLAGFTQCHFFAGIGGWSYALRLAGIPDSRRVWTGSAPCQPFSSAGEGAGFDDERHLWPALHHLARVGRPAEILGEQVASSLVDPWIDLVQADLEALGYAVGAVAFPSAGIGAPHIRDRCYWAGRLGDANLAGLEGLGRRHQAAVGQWQGAAGSAATASEFVRLAHADRQRGQGGHPLLQPGDGGHGGAADGLGHADSLRRQPGTGAGLRDQEPHAESWRGADGIPAGWDQRAGPGPVNGYWAAADWLACRDSKWRPVEPGTQPLADGVPGRVGLLRGYGNAVNVYAAKAFIEAFYGSI
jgi:DNA (cytosine-5)-methyltransferase 1